MIPGLEPIPVTRPLQIGACLTWVTKQPDWMRKVLIGGLWSLASLTLVALPIVVGYCVRVVRAGFAQTALPGWDSLGEMYREGLLISAIWLAHWGPLAVAVWAALRVGLLPAGDPHDNPGVFLVLFLCGTLATLAIAFYVNSTLLRVIVLRDIHAAVQVGESAAFARRNLPNFGRLLLLLVPANWIGQASCCLCGIGVFPGSFWVACTFNYALGQIGRCDIYLSKEVEAAG